MQLEGEEKCRFSTALWFLSCTPMMVVARLELGKGGIIHQFSLFT